MILVAMLTRHGRSRNCGESRISELGFEGVEFTHRPHSSSFLGLPCRILHMNHKKELLWGLWVKRLVRGEKPVKIPKCCFETTVGA